MDDLLKLQRMMLFVFQYFSMTELVVLAVSPENDMFLVRDSNFELQRMTRTRAEHLVREPVGSGAGQPAPNVGPFPNFEF